MDEADEGTTGFNTSIHKLHCLMVLHDGFAKALSHRADRAFWRGFITEDRRDGKVTARYRFRYVDGDQWCSIALKPNDKTVKQQVETLAEGMERTLRTGLQFMAGGALPPKDAVKRFYPPHPEDPNATLEWLFAQDLVEVKRIITPDGKETLVGEESEAVQ